VHPGDAATLAVTAYNRREGDFTWSVADLGGKTVASGTATLKDGRADVALPTAVRGWFEVTCAGEGLKPAKTTYAVTEPVEVKSIPSSRFGCHASESDVYRLLPGDEGAVGPCTRSRGPFASRRRGSISSMTLTAASPASRSTR